MQNEKIIKNHFNKIDPIIFKEMKDLDFSKWITPRPTSQFFLTLFRSIVSQQLSEKASETILTRVKELFPNKIITPQKVLNTPDQDFRRAGMSWAKVGYAKDLAQKTINKEVQFHALTSMSEKEVLNELIQIKGVGQWTVEMFLIFSLAREDIFSHGDAGLKRALMNLYILKNPKERSINRIVHKWKPYRSYGCIALWNYLNSS